MLLERRWILVFLMLLPACATLPPRIPEEWRSVPQAARIGSVGFDASGAVTTSPEPAPPPLSDGPIRVIGTRIFNRETPLTEPFPSIESLDFSEERGEVIFSATGVRGLDIGLVSSDGSPVNWVPQDPADELTPQWAPRGHKASYIVRGKAGDVIRTVHIPTAVQLSVPFPLGRVHARAWDAEGQFQAVAYSTPDASDRVEVMKYGGEERSTKVPPSVRLDVEVEPFGPAAILLRPRDLQYDERLPVVIWLAPDFAWNDARGALLQNARVAVIVVPRESAELWAAIDATPWLDGSRAWVVGLQDERRAPRAGAISIEPDATIAAEHYVRRGNVIAVAPAALEPFAAGFIANALTRPRGGE